MEKATALDETSGLLDGIRTKIDTSNAFSSLKQTAGLASLQDLPGFGKEKESLSLMSLDPEKRAKEASVDEFTGRGQQQMSDALFIEDFLDDDDVELQKSSQKALTSQKKHRKRFGSKKKKHSNKKRILNEGEEDVFGEEEEEEEEHHHDTLK
jgi:hypothetical protein